MAEPTISRPALLEPMDPEFWPEEVQVLIVGGGPVGLSSAILLAQRGIDVLLVERRSFESRFPRAHLLNVRTMEIFQEMGVADDIYALGPPDEDWRKVVWYTSVAGETPLHGMKLGEVPAWGGGADAPRYAAASPRKFANLPQIRLDPLLWAHAEAACPGRIRSHQELTAIEQHEGNGVTATLLDRKSGHSRSIRARYVIGADGGRACASLVGIERDGPKAIQDIVSLYVSMDLSLWSEPSALLAYFIQPQGGGRTVGTLQALGPYHYGRESPEWLVARSRRPGEEPNDDEATLVRRAREMLGLPLEHPMTLHAVSHWQYEGVVAERFRAGSVFLAGDAAHRHPPTGGLGLNGGVQDAHNLAWKLAAVLAGQAPDCLLDSYERERRPIAAYYTAHSLENAGRHAPIGAAIGLTPNLTEEQGWAQIAILASHTEEGRARREDVAAAVAENSLDYSQLGVEAGYAYSVGAIVPEPAEPSDIDDSPVEYHPTTRPGHHLPHVWLHHVDGATKTVPISTLDLVVAGQFTLFVDPSAVNEWRHAAAAVTGMPVTVVSVPDQDVGWGTARQVGSGGAVLARPDRKVGWRVTSLPGDPTAALVEAIDRILIGGVPTGEDPAAPYLERIRHAARQLTR